MTTTSRWSSTCRPTPYVPLVSTPPARVGEHGAREWLARQRGRWAERAGFSFAIAEASTDRAVGQLGLWLARWEEGAGTVGYLVAPSTRDGRADRTSGCSAGSVPGPELMTC